MARGKEEGEEEIRESEYLNGRADWDLRKEREKRRMTLFFVFFFRFFANPGKGSGEGGDKLSAPVGKGRRLLLLFAVSGYNTRSRNANHDNAISQSRRRGIFAYKAKRLRRGGGKEGGECHLSTHCEGGNVET